MSDLTIEHLVTAILAAIPATIAAISSIKNGQEQKRVRKELQETNGKISDAIGKPVLKKNSTVAPDQTVAPTSDAEAIDWYHAPSLF